MILRFTGGARVRFIVGMAPPADLDGFKRTPDLKKLGAEASGNRVAELQRTVAAQRDEIARPGRAGRGRPNIRPSGMEQATEGEAGGEQPAAARGAARGRSCRLTRNEPSRVAARRRAAHAFKGYTSFLVQESDDPSARREFSPRALADPGRPRW